VPADNEETFEHFCLHGWMRVRAAFSVDEAAPMRAAAWRALAKVGIPIFVAYTPKVMSTNARPVSSAALKSIAASQCKSSRIQAWRAT
jgi:hypothetical protein